MLNLVVRKETARIWKVKLTQNRPHLPFPLGEMCPTNSIVVRSYTSRGMVFSCVFIDMKAHKFFESTAFRSSRISPYECRRFAVNCRFHCPLSQWWWTSTVQSTTSELSFCCLQLSDLCQELRFSSVFITHNGGFQNYNKTKPGVIRSEVAIITECVIQRGGNYISCVSPGRECTSGCGV